jgi:stage II sporulation protein AA (anti-sigma F factor antagonist)
VVVLEWKLEKDTLTLYPQGDLDLVSAKRVREQLDGILCSRGSFHQLIVNLREVTFIDSSGLGMLIGCYKTMHGRQGRMMICDASERVYRLLELSGMKKLMPVMRQDASKTARGEGYGKR